MTTGTRPTREEIAEILREYAGGGRELLQADQILARLRPAFDHSLRYEEKAYRHLFSNKIDEGFAFVCDCLACRLRVDLRACAEALRNLSQRHKDLCSGGEECRLHDEADAALARPGCRDALK